MKLELGIMAGAESKAFLADLTKVVERFEKVASVLKTGTKAGNVSAETESEEDETDSEEEEEDFGTAKKTKSKKASFEDESEEEEENEDDTESSDEDEESEVEAEEEEEKPAKKAKKLTINDVNDACKLRAKRAGGKDGRKQVLDILKKKFKTATVSEIDEKLWPKVIAAMKE